MFLPGMQEEVVAGSIRYWRERAGNRWGKSKEMGEIDEFPGKIDEDCELPGHVATPAVSTPVGMLSI